MQKIASYYRESWMSFINADETCGCGLDFEVMGRSSKGKKDSVLREGASNIDDFLNKLEKKKTSKTEEKPKGKFLWNNNNANDSGNEGSS